jgi:UDP-N-acetylglucosamine acyltransferase
MYHTHGKFAGNYIHPTAVIGDKVDIGTGNYIEAGAVIGAAGHLRNVDPEDMQGWIMIGDWNRIGANTVIHYGRDAITTIGNDNMIMAFVNIGHDVAILNNTEICPHTSIAGHCYIGNNVKIKQNCTINTSKRLKDRTFIYSGSVLNQNTEEGASYVGSPAVKIGHNYINGIQ